MDSKMHIEQSLAKIRTIFEKASARIEAMKPGDKIPATKLAEELAEEIGMTGATLYPTLKFLYDKYPGVDIKRGAKGGIIKNLVSDPFPTPTTPDLL